MAVFAPMRIEAIALRRLHPVITGIGSTRSRSAVSRYLRSNSPTHLAVTGLGGSLRSDLRPGDVVVADKVVAADGRTIAEIPLASTLAQMLERSGINAVAGTTVTVTKLVTDDAERQELAHRHHALAVDMETVDILEACGRLPALVIRSISDAPGARLFSPATAKGVKAGLRSLAHSAPSIAAFGSLMDPDHSLSKNPPQIKEAP